MEKENKKTNTEKSKVKSVSEEAFESKLKKKQKNKAAKITLIVCIVFASILAVALGALLALKIYISNKVELISYESDRPVEDIVSGIIVEYPDLEEIVDVTVPPDFPSAPEVDDEKLPSFEIIDGKFDGAEVSPDYEDEVLNILLVGADTLDGNHARSDSMILMSVNTLKKKIVLTSFMRDSYVELPGLGYQRLNASHSLGGTTYLIETIEHNFKVDIDYYFKVDFTSFKEAVDAIGGMDLVVNDINYNYFYDWDGISGLSMAQACDGKHTVHLNGSQALLYARTRKGDRVENGDFGRTLHQRDFLTQFINNCKDASFSELDELLNIILPYTVTNMPAEVIESEVWNMLTYVSYDVSNGRVPHDGTWEYYTTPKGQSVLNVNIPANIKYLKAIIYG